MKQRLSLLTITGFIMSVIYTGLGIYLIISGPVLVFSPVQQYGIGAVLIFYGSVRFYSANRRRKDELSEDEEDDDE
jgi:threonine/homoserine/homoserine lactone efflux protein